MVCKMLVSGLVSRFKTVLDSGALVVRIESDPDSLNRCQKIYNWLVAFEKSLADGNFSQSLQLVAEIDKDMLEAKMSILLAMTDAETDSEEAANDAAISVGADIQSFFNRVTAELKSTVQAPLVLPLVNLVETVQNAGGVGHLGDGTNFLLGDPEWTDLSDVVMSAVDTLKKVGITPELKVLDCSAYAGIDRYLDEHL
jgi:hypothetical protein